MECAQLVQIFENLTLAILEIYYATQTITSNRGTSSCWYQMNVKAHRSALNRKGGHTCAPRRVEQKEWVLCVHPLHLALARLAGNGILPPDVPAFLELHLALLHRGCVLVHQHRRDLQRERTFKHAGRVCSS